MSDIPRDKMKTLFVACDHAGFKLKEHLQNTIPELPWEDLGTYSCDSVDYPDYAEKLALKIKTEHDFGVLICGSGQGMAIKANRFPFIRAALCWNEVVARNSRLHNNSNVLCLGERAVTPEEAERILITWLDTPFEGGRHQRRVEKLWVGPPVE